MNRLKIGGKSDIMDKSINIRWFNETTDVEKVVSANDLNQLDEYMADGKWKDIALKH